MSSLAWQCKPEDPANSKSINMTPMIDVLLVLLIIFMAVTPLKQAGLPAAVPQPANAQASPREETTVVLEISRDGALRLNSKLVEAISLPALLTGIFQARADRTLFLKASGELEYQQVAALIDTAKPAGVERVALMPR